MAAISLSEPVRRSSHSEGHKPIDDEQHRLPATIDRTPALRNRPRSCFTTSTFLFLFFIFVFVFVSTTIFNSWQISLVHSPDPGTDTVSGHAGNGQAPKKRHVGSVLRFLPADLVRRFDKGGLDRLRTSPRLGVRPPRLALVLGNMNSNPQSLMLLSIVKGLQELDYKFSGFALREGEIRPLWEDVCCEVSILRDEDSTPVDWSNYEGVILSSLEGKKVIPSLMQEPFCSIPLLWFIHEDILGKRLQIYSSSDWQDLISDWRSAFKRADVVVFPDFSLPMLYTSLDTGNFYVIPGSPVDFWAANRYMESHSRQQLRLDNGYNDDDLIVLVVGSYFFYDELPCDYAAMMALAPQMLKFARAKKLGAILKFAILCGNSADDYNSAIREVASRMGFPDDSVRHYGMDGDVNSVLLISDLVLYTSFQEEQTFPPLLVRAMSFGVPFIAPNSAQIEKYVIDKKHGFLYHPSDLNTLAEALTLAIKDNKLSNLAQIVSSYGKSFFKDLLAADCILGYANLIENVLQFPSDALLPRPFKQIKQRTWLWTLFENIGKTSSLVHAENSAVPTERSSIVYSLEEQLAGRSHKDNISQDVTETFDDLTQIDWDDIRDMEISQDFERRELQELEERNEKILGSWEEVYRQARKAEKQRPEAHERDEGELERTGQTLCVYEIYDGEGAWSFLHRGSLYRGISLSRGSQRPRTDDVDATSRLPILKDAFYRNLFCELGAMFSIANKIDSIHRTPWIGFQSWRTTGKKTSLSIKSEQALEDAIQAEDSGDVVYFWALMGMDIGNRGRVMDLDFWSMCDIFNGGHCRPTFEEAFRQMYGLSDGTAGLPPMPVDGGQWSTLHSWVMPTSSFLEFIMFSRMFVDSLDRLPRNSSIPTSCVLGSSELEKKHCYCRVLEVLVNVWAYHSARKMVYLHPYSGVLQEQHPIEGRKGLMWVKYFNFSLLKSMDEELAEETDDGIKDMTGRLWPLTGEVHWQGILDREREDRYRKKMDKKRKNKEKLMDRQKHGYKQKALGG
ncbi:putative glycosyl transferase, family 1 [Dioscorea sansibarensis]